MSAFFHEVGRRRSKKEEFKMSATGAANKSTKEVGGACTQADDTVNLMSSMCLMSKAVELQLFQPKIFIQFRRLVQRSMRLRACEKRKLPKIVSKLMVEVTKLNAVSLLNSQVIVFFLRAMFLWLDVKIAVARTVLALMEERVTRPVTSSANISRVNAVRMQQGTSVKLVQH